MTKPYIPEPLPTYKDRGYDIFLMKNGKYVDTLGLPQTWSEATELSQYSGTFNQSSYASERYGSVVVPPQISGSSIEGGEVFLTGAGTNSDIILDNYQSWFRAFISGDPARTGAGFAMVPSGSSSARLENPIGEILPCKMQVFHGTRTAAEGTGNESVTFPAGATFVGLYPMYVLIFATMTSGTEEGMSVGVSDVVNNYSIELGVDTPDAGFSITKCISVASWAATITTFASGSFTINFSAADSVDLDYMGLAWGYSG